MKRIGVPFSSGTWVPGAFIRHASDFYISFVEIVKMLCFGFYLIFNIEILSLRKKLEMCAISN